MKRLLFLLGFTNNSEPIVDLRKKPSKNFNERINNWIQMNFPIIALATIILIFIIFVWICFQIGVSAVESGTYYNHISEVI